MNIARKKSSFKAGMYLIETLTSGMYNEPLSIYREYIQNAVDSIDLSGYKSGKLKVNIDLNPFDQSIKIFDNGGGIPSKAADKVLSSIGSSNKNKNFLRGFRGIGRLGGLAFCDKATFRTKAQGEDVESIQEWDCKYLRKKLSDNSANSTMTLRQLFGESTQFYQKNGKGKNSSYFEVKLSGVSSFRNYILDIKKVKDYLCKVAPLPFNNDEFTFGLKIDNYLNRHISNYTKYEINLNGDSLVKPYSDRVRTTKKKYDYIDDIQFFQLKIENRTISYGWYGIRRDFIGSISKGEIIAGIRVRVGNLLIGDEHLLDGCFRETRFNGYTVGEIHVDCPNLVPNGRRDDFVDNEVKTCFYNSVEQKIGLPISKEIRLRSRLYARSKNKRKIDKNMVLVNQKDNNSNIINELRTMDKDSNTIFDHSNESENYRIGKILKSICNNCPNKSRLIAELKDKFKKQ